MLINLKKMTAHLLLKLAKWILFSQKLFTRLLPTEDVDLALLSNLVAHGIVEHEPPGELRTPLPGSTMEQVSLDTGYVILAKQYDFDICQSRIKMSWD